MKKRTHLVSIAFVVLGYFFTALTGCGIYSFSPSGGKASLSPDVKTVNVLIIKNEAPYQNPQLSPNLTDRLKQKITRQTKLTQTNGDNADLEVNASIRDYSVLTTGVTTANGQSQTSVNRLTVSVFVNITNRKSSDPKEASKEFTVSRSFDFSANQSLNQAEAQLLDEMVRNLSDEIFNRIFSDW